MLLWYVQELVTHEHVIGYRSHGWKEAGPCCPGELPGWRHKGRSVGLWWSVRCHIAGPHRAWLIGDAQKCLNE